jgi:hypothetical protein
MPAVPQIPKIVTFTLLATGDVAAVPVDFSLDVIDATITSAPGDVQKVTTLDGIVHQDVQPETWSLDLNAVQDWDSARPGLAFYLYTFKGQEAAFEYNANGIGVATAGLPSLSGTCRLVPISYGGTGNQFAATVVSLPVTGVPTLAP